MNKLLSFDVHVEITDPPYRVMHEAYDNRVSVLVGKPLSEAESFNLLTLRFTNPETVLAWGRDLTSAGMKFAAQQGTALPDHPDSGETSTAEDYPVPSKKANGVESGKPGESGSTHE